ncbi:MAG: sulfatase-like hydrolase/transferase [Spirochaetota bacterium]
MGMTRKDFLTTATAGALALGAHDWLSAAASKKPNIILILSDDHGLDGVGCYGSDKYKDLTPNIDALARTGMRFETCYSMPLCGPSRGVINTGRYGFRTGGLSNDSWRDDDCIGPKSKDEYPIARMLKQAGYATCCSGKWRQVGETPGDWGFDEWATDETAGGWHWKDSYIKNGKTVELKEESYIPDIYHDFAVDFMRRSRNGPFYLYYPTHLVHGPIQKTPDSKAATTDYYADNIAYLDTLVGKIIAEVDKLGIRENTIILFTGDNGTAKQSGTIYGKQINGSKGSMLEGGARVPLIVNWKGTTRASVCKDMADFSDFHATFAELAGASLPKEKIFDGRSFAPQLRGQTGSPRDWIFVQLGSTWYVRERGYKLNEAGALFDMTNAPFEEKLIAADAKDAGSMAARERLSAVLKKLNPAGGKIAPAGSGKPKKKKKKKADTNGNNE